MDGSTLRTDEDQSGKRRLCQEPRNGVRQIAEGLLLEAMTHAGLGPAWVEERQTSCQ